MKNKYVDLINQTFYFPTEEFKLDSNDNLEFHGIPMMDLIEQYGTPLKFTYLPKISENIQKARTWFNVAIAKADYQGKYYYCYCTKSNHFSHVIDEVLKNNVHIETSSAFDINILENLFEQGKISKDKFVVCNGFKRENYIENIANLINNDWTNVIPVMDNSNEIDLLTKYTDKPDRNKNSLWRYNFDASCCINLSWCHESNGMFNFTVISNFDRQTWNY